MMAQVLPQSYGSHLLGKPRDAQDSPAPTARDEKPHPERFHFPAAPDETLTQVAEVHEKPSDGPPRLSGESPSGSAPKKHTRKHMSLALPAFSFNPGAASEQEPGPATPSTPLSPRAGPPHASPSRGGRHRRIQSEFIGGDPGRSPISTRESSPITDEVTFRDLANDLPPVAKSPSKGHRHRRSGAMSSQDLSSVASQPPPSASKELKSLASDVGLGSPTFPPPNTIASNRPAAEHLRFANDSPGTSKSSSPVRVSFAENIEVIPRRSLPSLRNQPIPASVRAIHSSDGPRTTRPMSAPQRGHELRQSPLNTFGSWLADGAGVTAEPANDAGPGTTEDLSYALPLEVVDEAPIEVDGEYHSSLPGTFSFPDNFEDSDEQFGEPGFATLSEDFDADPTSADVYARPHFPQSPHFSEMRSSVPEASESVVDLDTALESSDSAVPVPTIEELRILRSKSFSAARHSMHSSGWPTSATSSLHRRTESAPSPPMPTFDRPTVSRFNSASASEKGFEMENVFEEDEEIAEAEAAAALESSDQDASPVIEEGHLPDRRQPQRSTTSDTVTPDTSPTKTNSTIKANKWLTETALRDSVSTITPDLLANIPIDDLHDTPSQPQSLMSSPPATPGTPSGIWASSTCDDWATDGASAPYSEASSFVDSQQLAPPKLLGEGGRASSDGTPSLISSRSTMNSGPHRQGSNAASPHLLDSVTLDGPRSSSGSGHVRWHKRSSIASLSRLMTGTGSTRSHLSMEHTPRCQTSDGLHDESKEAKDYLGKRKRLGRLLKYFRPKDAKEQAPG